MSRNSLVLRLGAAAAGLIAAALLVGGFGLFLIFDAALDRRTADELNHTAKLLAGQVAFDPAGRLTVEQAPADPRYATPYGGLYWQVESRHGGTLRSRSLWDKTLTLGTSPSAETPHHQTIDAKGPDGGALIAVVRAIRIANRTPPEFVIITVGLDRRELAASRGSVISLLAPSLLALGVALIVAMAAFVHRALGPFRNLREELKRIHEGKASQLAGRYPDEVKPLVDDLNRLIGLQKQALQRARTQAGDMAHGLKTPLAVLSAIARRSASVQPALAAEIDEQVESMKAQVSRALARTRAAASAGIERRRTAVAPVVGGLVQAISRLPDAERIEWRVELSPAAACPVSEGDLLEMLGNLLDNARKWSQGIVIISAFSDSRRDRIAIEDDGPGMDEAAISSVARGKRWDESTPGTGFGLAIAQDLVEATGGRLDLARSSLGGLEAVLSWPALNAPLQPPDGHHVEEAA